MEMILPFYGISQARTMIYLHSLWGFDFLRGLFRGWISYHVFSLVERLGVIYTFRGVRTPERREFFSREGRFYSKKLFCRVFGVSYGVPPVRKIFLRRETRISLREEIF